MTWIRTILPPLANDSLRRLYDDLHRLYPPEYSQPVASLLKPDGSSDGVVAAHSLLPKVMWHMMAGLAELLREEHGLTRRQQEMIASVVSAQNRCFY